MVAGERDNSGCCERSLGQAIVEAYKTGALPHIPGGGSGGDGITVANEGAVLGTSITKIDFVGADVEALLTGPGEVTVYIPPHDFAPEFELSPISTSNRRLSRGGHDLNGWFPEELRPTTRTTPIIYDTGVQVSFPSLTTTFLVTLYNGSGTIASQETFGPITGDGTQTLNGFTLEISNWEGDANLYKARVRFTITLPTAGTYYVEITHIGTTAPTFNQSMFFYDPDDVPASLSGVDYALTTEVIKYLSGVRYLDTGSEFTHTIDQLDHLNNRSWPTNFVQLDMSQLGSGATFLQSDDLTDWEDWYDNVGASYTGLTAISVANFLLIGSANTRARWIDWSNGPYVNSPSKLLLIDTNPADSSDIEEEFRDEIYRKSNLYGAWDSTALLAAGDLMVQAGELRVQYGDWTPYIPVNVADYSSSGGALQCFYRGFRHNGISHSNGLFHIGGVSESDLDGDLVRLSISLDGVSWYNCNEPYAGGSLSDGDGCRINADSRPLPELEFTLGTGAFTNAGTGPDGWGIYFRLCMPGSSTVRITHIRLTSWA